jgi:hypothetical protein
LEVEKMKSSSNFFLGSTFPAANQDAARSTPVKKSNARSGGFAGVQRKYVCIELSPQSEVLRSANYRYHEKFSLPQLFGGKA